MSATAQYRLSNALGLRIDAVQLHVRLMLPKEALFPPAHGEMLSVICGPGGKEAIAQVRRPSM